jgi:hypothetical protein
MRQWADAGRSGIMSRDNETGCAGTVGNGWQHYSASAIKTERTEERNFRRDELDAYRDLRLTGLAPRSRDWLIRTFSTEPDFFITGQLINKAIATEKLLWNYLTS